MNERNEIIRMLAKVCMALDRLQVELSDDTPYPVPSREETRMRILSTFDDLDKVSDYISNLGD